MSNPGKHVSEKPALQEVAKAAQEAARALNKDASALAHQSAFLVKQAADVRALALYAEIPAPVSFGEGGLLTIPEAAGFLGVSERTLRRLMKAPDLQGRLVERTRKIGIYHKHIALLPPDLLAEAGARLRARLSRQAPPKNSQEENPQEENIDGGS